MSDANIRIDLHVHSKYSTRPSQWILQKIGCPESFAEPLDIYRIAKKKGMTLVTITDHNRIDGALEIAHLPDTFLSEEITTYFPEDHCKVHVLAWNITEAQHQDIQKARENIFDLTAYLKKSEITHAVAHPMYGVNDRLTIEHIEQMLLLFKNFELNGARNDATNQCLTRILSGLDAAVIDRLVDKYGLEPDYDAPWKKTLVGGSDDHSALHIACHYTEIDRAKSVEGVIAGINAGETRVVRNPSSPLTMAHVLYSIAYQYYRNKFNLGPYADKDKLLTFLDRSLTVNEIKHGSGIMTRLYHFWSFRKKNQTLSNMPDSLLARLHHETDKLLKDNPQLIDITRTKSETRQSIEREWFDFVTQVSNRVLSNFAGRLLDHIAGANLFDILKTVASAGGLYGMLAPYFIGFAHFVKDRDYSREVSRRFSKDAPRDDESNVAYFTDTFYGINDIALTLQHHVKSAIENKKEITVVTCDHEKRSDSPIVKVFQPVSVYDIPEYNEKTLYFPPLLEMLRFCYDNKFTRIHSATPGPIGLAALVVAHILKLPISANYFTSLPLYAQMLTDDENIEEMAWKFVLWYYRQMDVIYVPSKSVKQELTRKGIPSEKLMIFPNMIDVGRFHPRNRNGILSKKYSIQAEVKLLYVGHISKTKNLHLLARVFKALSSAASNIHLVVVGDGPYTTEMKSTLSGTPCTFTGYLDGEELSAVYASCDIFVFPSAVDTLGRAVLEAQASGLPVIVCDKGGPSDNVIPGKTGLVIKSNDTAGLVDAVIALMSDPDRVRAMGQAARKYIEDLWLDTAFFETWPETGPSPAREPVDFAEAV